jgi:hypothetical protein
VGVHPVRRVPAEIRDRIGMLAGRRCHVGDKTPKRPPKPKKPKPPTKPVA